MTDKKLTETELKLAEIIWDNEPVPSGKLVKLCESEFSWKKSTTYTMLKKLIEKEIALNENSIVTSALSQEDFYSIQSVNAVEENFKGSLPKFLTAFSRKKKLSSLEIEEIQKMIDGYKEDTNE